MSYAFGPLFDPEVLRQFQSVSQQIAAMQAQFASIADRLRFDPAPFHRFLEQQSAMTRDMGISMAKVASQLPTLQIEPLIQSLQLSSEPLMIDQSETVELSPLDDATQIESQGEATRLAYEEALREAFPDTFEEERFEWRQFLGDGPGESGLAAN